MHNNSINSQRAVAAVLLFLLLHCSEGPFQPAYGQPQPDNKPSNKCQPDKINQLLLEIMACQAQKQQPMGIIPAIPRGGALPPQYPAPRGYPPMPSSGPGSSDDFDFLNNRGPTFITGSPSGGGRGGIGVLVSRPVPADVRPVQGDGLPSNTDFFIAGPRTRPNSFPSFGSGFGEGFPFALDPFSKRAHPQGPQDDPQQSGGNNELASKIFPSFASSFGGEIPSSPRFDSRLGGPPSFGNPFESIFPSTGVPSGGNTFSFEISPTGEESNPLGFDLNEILRILKELQSKDNGDTGSGDGDEKQQNPDLNTTQTIIDVDTTMSPTTDESITESTAQPTTMAMPTEKP